MTKRLLLLALLFVANTAYGQDPDYPVRVTYIEGTVSSTNNDVVSLLDGSTWLKSGYMTLLPMSDIFIILLDEKGNGIAFSDGSQIDIRHVSGRPVSIKQGLLSVVVRSRGDGAILELIDGSLWEIPEYDQYDTGYWLPPYHVIITSGQMNLINIEENETVWAERIR